VREQMRANIRSEIEEWDEEEGTHLAAPPVAVRQLSQGGAA